MGPIPSSLKLFDSGHTPAHSPHTHTHTYSHSSHATHIYIYIQIQIQILVLISIYPQLINQSMHTHYLHNLSPDKKLQLTTQSHEINKSRTKIQRHLLILLSLYTNILIITRVKNDNSR